MTTKLPPLDVLFDFTYEGGGYFRQKGVARGKSAKILHGDQVVKYLYEKIEQSLKETSDGFQSTNKNIAD